MLELLLPREVRDRVPNPLKLRPPLVARLSLLRLPLLRVQRSARATADEVAGFLEPRSSFRPRRAIDVPSSEVRDLNLLADNNRAEAEDPLLLRLGVPRVSGVRRARVVEPRSDDEDPSRGIVEIVTVRVDDPEFAWVAWCSFGRVVKGVELLLLLGRDSLDRCLQDGDRDE